MASENHDEPNTRFLVGIINGDAVNAWFLDAR